MMCGLEICEETLIPGNISNLVLILMNFGHGGKVF